MKNLLLAYCCLVFHLTLAQTDKTSTSDFSLYAIKLVPDKIDSLPDLNFGNIYQREDGPKTSNRNNNQLQEWKGFTWMNAISAICVTNNCSEGTGGGQSGGNPIFPPSITASTSTVCTSAGAGNPTSVTLTASGCSGNQKIQWYRNNDLPIGIPTNNFVLTLTPSASSTQYFATCVSSVDANFESARSNKKTITRLSTPSIPTASATPATPILAGHTVNLTANGCLNGSIYNWDNLGNGQNQSDTPLSTTLYKVYCVNSVCKSTARDLNVVVLKPFINSTTDSVCFDNNTQTSNSVTLTLSNCSGEINWNSGQTTQTITVTPNVTTSYIAYCKTPIDVFSFSNVKIIRAFLAPEITKANGTNNDFILTADCQAGSNVLWSTGASTESISVPNNQVNEYFAQCGDNNCLSRPSKIKINAAPDISANIKTICQGQSLVLTATECSGTIEWFRAVNSTTNFISAGTGNPHTYNVPFNQSTTKVFYKATCTDGTASDFSNTINIGVLNGTIPPSPTITSVPSSAIINIGNFIELNAVGCGSFDTRWTTGDNTATIIKNPEVTTTYSAYCLDACPSILSNKTVQVFNIQAPTITVSDTVICEGGSLTLSSPGCYSNNSQLNWYRIPQADPETNPILVGSTNPLTLYVTESSIYMANCTKSGATSDFSNTVLVSYSKKPDITNGDDNDTLFGAIYQNQTLELIASGCSPGDTYLWNTTEISANIFVTPDTSTTYIAQCTNATCTTIGRDYYVKLCPATLHYQSPDDDFVVTPAYQPESASSVYAVNSINNAGTKVNYTAAENIVLNPGFMASTGTIFIAEISGCKRLSDYAH